MASYEDTLVRGFIDRISGHGVSGVESGPAIRVGESEAVPGHRVMALSRVLGRRVEGTKLIVTAGFGTRLLGAVERGSLHRFELMAWVDEISLPGLSPPDVLAALSTMGRIIHTSAKPGAAPWHAGHTLTFPDEGLAGWNRYLLARAMRPVDTEFGAVDIVRVLPISHQEALELQTSPDMMGGWGLVTRVENADLEGVLARFRTPPGGPPPVLRVSRVAFEPAGDTLRVFIDDSPFRSNAMRDVVLGLDAGGHLLAVELFAHDGPRALLALGPRAAIVRRAHARALQTDAGALLFTMAEKRIRGNEAHPHVPWSRLA
ncbi:MAG: hypothetical protein U0414_13780 [Polyangiaceae bacterium]